MSRSTDQVVASQRVAAKRLARFDLTPGRYTVVGTFDDVTTNGSPDSSRPVSVTVTGGHTTHRDIVLFVP